MATKRTFGNIGVDNGALSEEDAELVVDAHYETRAQTRGFWKGVFVAAVPSLLLGIAAVIKLYL